MLALVNGVWGYYCHSYDRHQQFLIVAELIPGSSKIFITKFTFIFECHSNIPI